MPESPASWRERLAGLPAPVSSVATLPGRALAVGAALAGLAVALAVAVVASRGAPPAPELTLPRADQAGSPAPAGAAGTAGAPAEPEADAYVHAAGAVARPGVYRVRPGGRVADLLDAAGGPAPEADLDQVNLAARVTDGERVFVPRRGEAPPPLAAGGGGAAAGGAASGPVDLNTATLEQLDALPGVGPATAQAILDFRQEHGRFTQVQELLEVRGIGEAKLAALRSRVRV